MNLAPKDHAFSAFATSYTHKSRRKFDNSKRMPCVFVLAAAAFVFISDLSVKKQITSFLHKSRAVGFVL